MMIILMSILIYIILNTSAFYYLLRQDKKIENHMLNIIKNNTVFNYISEPDIKSIINYDSKYGFFSNEKLKFIELYIAFPLFLLVPFFGQYTIGSLYLAMVNDKKQFSDEYINKLCYSKFLETLKNSYYNIGKDLDLLRDYTTIENIKIIKNFLIEVKNPYYALGFKNFETLITIIKEQKEQLKYETVNASKIESKIVNIINDYVNFINEINNKVSMKLESNNVEKYSELLQCMTNDIKNGKY